MPSVLQNEDQFALMPVPGLEDAEFSSSRIVAGELIVEPKAKLVPHNATLLWGGRYSRPASQENFVCSRAGVCSFTWKQASI